MSKTNGATRTVSLKSLKGDPRNANRGTERYAMDINPGCVAVGLERMADMGLKPKLAKGEGKA
jgi:hypothetical protein